MPEHQEHRCSYRHRKKLRDSLNGQKLAELVNQLASIGVSEATVLYQGAWYDGDNDVTVTLKDATAESSTKVTATITATGKAVLFIEFGTGVYYYDDPAVRAAVTSGNLLGRGEFGDKRGSRMGWVYVDTSNERVFTRGNPSNACMYDTMKYLEERLVQIAKEVIQW